MKSILLDTNAYAAFKRAIPHASEIIQNAPTIAVNTIVLGEIFSGFAGGSKDRQNRRELNQFLASPRVSVLPIDFATAEQYASILIALKINGTPIPTNDLWIAASALRHGLALFSFDAHFHNVKNLQVGTSIDELQ
jgi:tRNA(fMet)-specific endonuclease VapC